MQAATVSNLSPIADIVDGYNKLEAASRMSAKEFEAIYTSGYQLYSQGKLERAVKLFQLLVIYRRFDPRYLEALAQCQRRLKRYAEAADSYGTLLLLRPDDPTPAVHAGECLLRSGRRDDAITLLRPALRLASLLDPKSALCRRAQNLLTLAENVDASVQAKQQ